MGRKRTTLRRVLLYALPVAMLVAAGAMWATKGEHRALAVVSVSFGSVRLYQDGGGRLTIFPRNTERQKWVATYGVTVRWQETARLPRFLSVMFFHGEATLTTREGNEEMGPTRFPLDLRRPGIVKAVRAQREFDSPLFGSTPPAQRSDSMIWPSMWNEFAEGDIDKMIVYWPGVRYNAFLVGAPLLALVAFPWLGVISYKSMRQRKRLREGRCLSCGYSLTGLASGACPECSAASAEENT